MTIATQFEKWKYCFSNKLKVEILATDFGVSESLNLIPEVDIWSGTSHLLKSWYSTGKRLLRKWDCVWLNPPFRTYSIGKCVRWKQNQLSRRLVPANRHYGTSIRIFNARLFHDLKQRNLRFNFKNLYLID